GPLARARASTRARGPEGRLGCLGSAKRPTSGCTGLLTSSNVRVRAETPRDWEAVAAVTEAAFGKAREARMIEAIRASSAFVPELSLVAEDDGVIVGHIVLSYVGLEGTSKRLLELGPMSVLPARQRSGIGSR